jgi:hypothetical protein
VTFCDFAARHKVIAEGDELVAKPGSGQFVKRARFGARSSRVRGRKSRRDVGAIRQLNDPDADQHGRIEG